MGFLNYVKGSSDRDWVAPGVGSQIPRYSIYILSLAHLLNILNNVGQSDIKNHLIFWAAGVGLFTLILFLLYITHNYRERTRGRVLSIWQVLLRAALITTVIVTTMALLNIFSFKTAFTYGFGVFFVLCFLLVLLVNEGRKSKKRSGAK